MSKIAGYLPRKFSSFRHLDFESSAHNLPEKRESENPRNVVEIVGTNTVEICKTSFSPAKDSSCLQDVPVQIESIATRIGNEDRYFTMAEKDCVLTSSDDGVEDLSAFVTARLQCLSDGSVETLIGEGSVNVEEILCVNVGIGVDGGGNGQSVCPNVTPSEDVIEYSPGKETDRIQREELGRGNITSTPERAAWPIYTGPFTKRRGSVLGEQEVPLCKAVIFDVASGSGTVGGVELSRENVTDRSEGVPESLVTGGGFSTLEGIARRQADERFVGTRMGDEGEGMVRVPPVDEMFGQEAAREERTRYYPSQSAESLLKDCFEMNPSTYLDPSHPTKSFSADQMIQFSCAVGLVVSVASCSMLEDLLLKARGGSRAYPVTSRYPAGRSPFPSVAGSLMGDSVASRSVYSSPTITETEGTSVIVGGGVVEEPCFSRQADARLAMGTESTKKPGTESLKTLQQIKSSQKSQRILVNGGDVRARSFRQNVRNWS